MKFMFTHLFCQVTIEPNATLALDSLVLEGRGDDVYRHMVDSIVALGGFGGGWSGRVYSCVCRRVDQQ